MTNYNLHLSYDGTCYSGFQVQKNAKTIQEVLEQALQVLYQEEIKIIGASRTDAGVHARQQVINFKASPKIPASRLPVAINRLLPSDIKVWHAEVVPENFNARRMAREKLYRYTIDTGVYPDVFRRLYAWHFPHSLDLSKMKEAGACLVGKHDFTSFKAAGSEIYDNTRTIYYLEWHQQDNFLAIDISGEGFLYKMVRIIVGTLAALGSSKKTDPNHIEKILQAKDRKWASETAPPHGLCLWSIKYQL